MILITIGASLLTSLILVGLTRQVAQGAGLVDVPNALSSHVAPTTTWWRHRHCRGLSGHGHV